MKTLVVLGLLASGPPWEPERVVIQQEGAAPAEAPVRLESSADLARLCSALLPVERLRLAGDAVDRGEAKARHAEQREAALRARYEVRVPAAGLAFATYDLPARRLSLTQPTQIPVGGGIARLWPTEESGLAVEAGTEAARRLVRAQQEGTLELALVFDLPDDTSCGMGGRAERPMVPIEPVSWRWLDGDRVLAAGGSDADFPLLSAAQGAKPKVVIGEPLWGPTEVRRTLALRLPSLVACYAEALRRAPALEGVLVAVVGGARTAIAADSLGDTALVACVLRSFGPLAGAPGEAVVPIRFELVSNDGAAIVP